MELGGVTRPIGRNVGWDVTRPGHPAPLWHRTWLHGTGRSFGLRQASRHVFRDETGNQKLVKRKTKTAQSSQLQLKTKGMDLSRPSLNEKLFSPPFSGTSSQMILSGVSKRKCH